LALGWWWETFIMAKTGMTTTHLEQLPTLLRLLLAVVLQVLCGASDSRTLSSKRPSRSGGHLSNAKKEQIVVEVEEEEC
jgi:hypothetical protein